MIVHVVRQLPPPPTLTSDWLPDYIPGVPGRVYVPRKPSPGSRYVRKGRRLTGKHSEKRLAQWRESKRRAHQRGIGKGAAA